jgi:hypothetical protein
VWHDFSSNGDDIQLRPQYMQPLAGKAEEEVEVGDGREGDKQVDMDLMHKQNLLSDVWGGLRVIQENNLLTEQMVEAIACFVAIALDMSATDVVLKGESGEMLTQLGRVPTEKSGVPLTTEASKQPSPLSNYRQLLTQALCVCVCGSGWSSYALSSFSTWVSGVGSSASFI